MKLMVRENDKTVTIEGAEARTVLRRALREITGPLLEVAQDIPAIAGAVLQDAHKTRRRAVDCLQRGEWIWTKADEHGHPSGGMNLCMVVTINKIIKEDGTEVIL